MTHHFEIPDPERPPRPEPSNVRTGAAVVGFIVTFFVVAPILVFLLFVPVLNVLAPVAYAGFAIWLTTRTEQVPRGLGVGALWALAIATLLVGTCFAMIQGLE